MWKFDPLSGSWWWLAGPKKAGAPRSENYPPALANSSTFATNGTLWVFGGYEAYSYQSSKRSN